MKKWRRCKVNQKVDESVSLLLDMPHQHTKIFMSTGEDELVERGRPSTPYHILEILLQNSGSSSRTILPGINVSNHSLCQNNFNIYHHLAVASRGNVSPSIDEFQFGRHRANNQPGTPYRTTQAHQRRRLKKSPSTTTTSHPTNHFGLVNSWRGSVKNSIEI